MYRSGRSGWHGPGRVVLGVWWRGSAGAGPAWARSARLASWLSWANGQATNARMLTALTRRRAQPQTGRPGGPLRTSARRYPTADVATGLDRLTR